MAAAKILKLSNGRVVEQAVDDEFSIGVDGAIAFSAVADDADELDSLILPRRAGTPTATPTNGEGSVVWDSTNNLLYIWDGSAWNNAFASAASAQSVRNSYTADENLLIRDALYISAADNVSKADASAEATARVIGLAVAAANDTESVLVQSEGVMGGFTGLTAGAPYYLSETAGEITDTPPTTANAVVYLIGYAKSTTALHLQLAYVATRS